MKPVAWEEDIRLRTDCRPVLKAGGAAGALTPAFPVPAPRVGRVRRGRPGAVASRLNRLANRGGMT